MCFSIWGPFPWFETGNEEFIILAQKNEYNIKHEELQTSIEYEAVRKFEIFLVLQQSYTGMGGRLRICHPWLHMSSRIRRCEKRAAHI